MRYVPSTSFSIVMGPESSGTQAVDAKTQELQDKVYKARETRYRVEDVHYQQTLRVSWYNWLLLTVNLVGVTNCCKNTSMLHILNVLWHYNFYHYV